MSKHIRRLVISVIEFYDELIPVVHVAAVPAINKQRESRIGQNLKLKMIET